jgi:secreted trypsin-like serine protease
MLALLREEEMEGGDAQSNPFKCGASLIHPQVALTAAHCVSRYLMRILPTFISLFISICHLNEGI